MFERHIETNEFLHVPFSNNLYRVNIQGKIIYDKGALTGQPVTTTLTSNGDALVRLDSWDGLKDYRVAEVVAHTFKPTKLPLNKWKKITVLFRDGDRNNLHPANLVWKFPTGLTSDRLPDYAFIPMFSRYVINRQGKVVNLLANSELSSYRDKNGYVMYGLTPDLGNRTIVGRHRLLCLAWKDYPVDVDRLHTNHRDGIPGNDELDNLEWATPSGNIIHAYENGLRPDNLPVLVKNVKTGVVTEYVSHSECGSRLGLSGSTIDERLKAVGQPLYPGYLQFKHKDDLTPWREVIDPEQELRDRKFPTPVMVRNAKTKEVKEFNNISDCAKHFKVSTSIIAYRCDSNQKLFPGYLQFKHKDDYSPWREPLDLEEEERTALLTKNKEAQSLVVRDIKTGIVTEYNSIRGYHRVVGGDIRGLVKKLKAGSHPIYKGRDQVKFKDDNRPWLATSDQESLSN